MNHRSAPLVALAIVVVAVVACGAEPEAPRTIPTCITAELGALVCDGSPVYVFEPVDGGSVAYDCASHGCPSGARCAVFQPSGTVYGHCQ